MASQQFYHNWIDFETKKEVSLRSFGGSSTLKDRDSKHSCVFVIKSRG